MFTNLGHALTAAGAGWEHLIKLGYFVRDITQITAVRAIRDQFLPEGVRPAGTLVKVSALFRDDLLIEIQAEIPYPLSRVVTDIEQALRRKSLHDRITEKLARDPAWS